MPRCVTPRRVAVFGPMAALARLRATAAAITSAAAVAAALTVATPAVAQGQRNFPASALRGELQVTQPPEVLLNGKPARLAPGARIRGENNLLVVPSALAEQRLVVHYTYDLAGSLLDIWVLSATERARQPWPTSTEQAAAWRFDPIAQTWSKP